MTSASENTLAFLWQYTEMQSFFPGYGLLYKPSPWLNTLQPLERFADAPENSKPLPFLTGADNIETAAQHGVGLHLGLSEQ